MKSPMAGNADSAHPAALRWSVLALSCLLMVGNYYCYDNPAALKTQMQLHFNALSRGEFEWRFVRGARGICPIVLVGLTTPCECSEPALHAVRYPQHGAPVLRRRHCGPLRDRGDAHWVLELDPDRANGVCDWIIVLELQPHDGACGFLQLSVYCATHCMDLHLVGAVHRRTRRREPPGGAGNTRRRVV